MEIKPMVTDVMEFLKKCADIAASFEHDTFHYNEFYYIQKNPVDSPIEQILHCALKTIMKLNFMPDADCVRIDGKDYVVGANIIPQVQIGKYRVDFIVSLSKYPKHDGTQDVSEVIVECDSQAFHERSEKERRYEKERDRFLQRNGHKVFHFTGKEIKDTPFKVAAEIISHITGWNVDEIVDPNFITEG